MRKVSISICALLVSLSLAACKEKVPDNTADAQAIKKLSISKAQAEGFYYVHKERPFFDSLTSFMSSGPIFPLVLEKDNAIADLRKLMGATNPANADEGTIRKKYAGSIEENAVHGSDGEDTAKFEIGYFFTGYELA